MASFNQNMKNLGEQILQMHFDGKSRKSSSKTKNKIEILKALAIELIEKIDSEMLKTHFKTDEELRSHYEDIEGFSRIVWNVLRRKINEDYGNNNDLKKYFKNKQNLVEKQILEMVTKKFNEKLNDINAV